MTEHPPIRPTDDPTAGIEGEDWIPTDDGDGTRMVVLTYAKWDAPYDDDAIIWVGHYGGLNDLRICMTHGDDKRQWQVTADQLQDFALNLLCVAANDESLPVGELHTAVNQILDRRNGAGR